MNRKRILIVLAVITILVVPFSVFAATSDAPAAKTVRGFFGMDMSKLTDQQKADVEDFSQKMAELQKDFVNKMVANGSMTKEQGEAELKRIDGMLENGAGNGFMPGLRMGIGGFGGREMKGGFGPAIDTSKLTDQQKADLMDSYKKASDMQKELMGKMTANGLMTEEQGETAVKRIDDMIASLDENGLSKSIGMFMRGFGAFDCFGIKGFNTSKLTDEQKADLEDFSQKISELHKEFIGKLTNYGVITAEQGDSIINRTDDIGKFSERKGFPGGMGMMKRPFGNRGQQQ